MRVMQPISQCGIENGKKAFSAFRNRRLGPAGVDHEGRESRHFCICRNRAGDGWTNGYEADVTNTRGLKTGLGNQHPACTDKLPDKLLKRAAYLTNNAPNVYPSPCECRLVNTCNRKSGDGNAVSSRFGDQLDLKHPSFTSEYSVPPPTLQTLR